MSAPYPWRRENLPFRCSIKVPKSTIVDGRLAPALAGEPTSMAAVYFVAYAALHSRGSGKIFVDGDHLNGELRQVRPLGRVVRHPQPAG
jgi:hypothetical protein